MSIPRLLSFMELLKFLLGRCFEYMKIGSAAQYEIYIFNLLCNEIVNLYFIERCNELRDIKPNCGAGGYSRFSSMCGDSRMPAESSACVRTRIV